MSTKDNISYTPIIKDIVFIHGITSFAKSHVKIHNRLTKLGYRFHYFDLPGHGKHKKDWEKRKFTFEDMLKATSKYISTNIKDRPFIIMGHSMGGGITLATYPKYKSQIKAIMLECPLTPGLFNRTEEKSKSSFKDIRINISKYKKIIGEHWTRFRIGVYKWLSKDRCFAPLLLNITKSDAMNKIDKGIKAIDVPTLLIVGQKDRVIPPLATIAYLEDNLPIITTQTAIGSGHNPFKDTPQQYEEFITDFLRKVNS